MERNIITKCLITIIIIPGILILSGCSVTKKVPISLQPGFTPNVVDEITVFPVADLRFDKTDKLKMENVDGWMQNTIEFRLKKYGYKVNILTDRALVYNLTEDDLSGDSHELIKKIAPPNSNWILITGLMDSESKLTFGSTANAEVTGYFYNKTDGTIIWHDKGIGKTGQGGLMGMAMKGLVAKDAIGYATVHLMQSFPEK